MKDYLTESLVTPRKYECDVCVCGGGVAGIAAALSAKRAGAERVILLERSFMLGGLATAGLVTIYLALCDGYGHQVCFGLAEELFKLSIEHGAEDRYPTAWLDGGTVEERAKRRFEVQFNAQLFALSAERLLRREGVKIMYGASVSGACVEDGRITDIIIEGKGGREAVSVRGSVVDCTGDADVCKLAGARTANYAPGNKLASWYYGVAEGELDLYMVGVHDVNDDKNATDLQDKRRFTGLDTDELSEMVQIGHSAMMRNFIDRRSVKPDLVPVTIATTPEVRMTRRLVGAYTQDIDEVGKRYPDTVGIFPNWKKIGPVYELPFSALYGNDVKNLAAAGRCISVTDEMWDVTRVIPVCAVSGEAAGAAAAMCSDFAKIDIKKLQDHLLKSGVLLHNYIEELK
ncbi:MAG: FAD-dependent oxidoreductase [Clostridia bacterium]|nr:FAD-dependent oxidoreductase [Clostridia bacterium]